MVFELPQLNY
jgi:hypothetical protein